MATRRKYRDKYLRWHSTYEKRATTEISKVFKGWFLNVDWQNLTDNYQMQIDNAFDEKSLFQAYVTIYTEIGKKHGLRVLKDIETQTKADPAQEFLINFQFNIEEFLRQYGLERIKTVQKSLFDEIVKLIENRLKEGKDIRQVAKDIEVMVNRPNFYRWRALRIARTESTAASNYAAIRSAYYGGFEVVKEWISAHDARTRRHPESEYDHEYMDGKRVGINDPFIFNQGSFDEDRLQYPGDPKGQPGNVINCRCAVAVVPKRDKDGRLIPLKDSMVA